MVSNACGTKTTNTITIESLCVAPSVILQPRSQTLAPGESTVLHVSGNGSPQLRYQWYERPLGGAFTKMVGWTSTTVTVVPQTTSEYMVRITNDCGSVDSDIALITVQ